MLTFAQRRWLIERSNVQGRIACPGRNGFIKASWTKVMENLRAAGHVDHSHDGEYELTSKGEAYKEGALAAEIVWWKVVPRPTTNEDVMRLVSETIGPNVHHHEEVTAGAKVRWADLRAGRVFARCRVLPRHDVGRQGGS